MKWNIVSDWTLSYRENSMMHGGMDDWHWGFGFGHGLWGILLWLLVIMAVILVLKFMWGGIK